MLIKEQITSAIPPVLTDCDVYELGNITADLSALLFAGREGIPREFSIICIISVGQS